MPNKKPNRTEAKINALVARNLRLIRRKRGIYQSELAAMLGIQRRQMQKMEYGQSRISAGRLWRIQNALNASLEEIFEGAYYYPKPQEKEKTNDN